MSDGTKKPNGSSKKMEVVEVDEKELDVDLKIGATMFDVDDVRKKLNSEDKEAKVVDGEEILNSLEDDFQIYHVKGGKQIDSKDKPTKKEEKTKKGEPTSEKREVRKKDTEYKEDR